MRQTSSPPSPVVSIPVPWSASEPPSVLLNLPPDRGRPIHCSIGLMCRNSSRFSRLSTSNQLTPWASPHLHIPLHYSSCPRLGTQATRPPCSFPVASGDGPILVLPLYILSTGTRLPSARPADFQGSTPVNRLRSILHLTCATTLPRPRTSGSSSSSVSPFRGPLSTEPNHHHHPSSSLASKDLP